MIPYSLHVALLLAVCLLFYKVLLQKETYYRLNRVILLTCLALAFLLPLIPVPQQFSWFTKPAPVVVQVPVNAEQFDNQLPAETPVVLPGAPVKQAIPEKAVVKSVAKQPSTITKTLTPSIPVMELIIKWALLIYWCGVAAFGLNLLVQVAALLIQAYKKPAIHDGIYRIVELDTDKAPCSFGNSIFINPEKYDWETYNQILIHEKVHIQQGHSLDLLLAELMLVVQWFNPFAWLYRKELESNLEFLTDDEVLHHNEVAIADYQMSLLKVSVPNFSMRITTNYNQSLLKKRIVMMNAKKSNVHTMWKYFMLMPLLLALVCGLNKPMIAAASPSAKFQQGSLAGRNIDKLDWTHGTWFATIKGDKVYIQFEADENDEHHNWSSSRNFNLSDFPNLPKGEKADFTLTREAGAVVFNGRFDGDQGLGHYKFTPNKEYGEFMAKQNIAANDDDGYFNFFMANVKKEYVTFLKENGFKDIPRNQVMSMSYQNIDAAYIKYWKDLGYSNLTPNELVSLKSQKVDAAYVNDIKKAGYTNLTVRELISFHSQGITGDYINGLKKANVVLPGATAPAALTPREVITSKNMHVDSAYVSGMRNAGRGGDNFNQLTTLKSLNVTPEYVKSFEDIGFKDIPQSTLITMKREDITPEYVKAFKDMGYSDRDISNLVRMKREGITPEYVKSFSAVGYTSISVNTLMRLASQKITPQDVRSYQDLGLKVDASDMRRGVRENMIAKAGLQGQGQDPATKQDIVADGMLSPNAIAGFKQQGITPEYVKSFKGTGYKDLSPSTIRQFKSEGVTPADITALQVLGYKDVPAYSVKLVTPDYIKSFVDIGYKDVPLDQYANLKRIGVTADFVTGFNKLGFANIPVNQLGFIKRSGITPEFIADMKQKGFDSKDLNKYIQLKNFNSETGNMQGQKARAVAPQGNK